jgi:hypothetical protein
MPDEKDLPVGTEELETGMRAGYAREFAVIFLIVSLILLTCNSGGLARWTETLPSSAASAWVAEQAARWHQLMLEVGPARMFEDLRKRLKIE